jgi:hypothetical protein
MTKLTVGEYADLETYCKGGVFNVLEKLCAILFREVKVEKGDRYEIALYSPDEESKKTMLDLPMNIAVAAVVFFCNTAEELVSASERYFNQQKEKKEETRYTPSGDGSVLSIKWLRGIFFT